MNTILRQSLARGLRKAAQLIAPTMAAPASPAAVPASGIPAAGPGSVTQDDILRFCRYFASYEAQGFEKVRLGNAYDGGYIFLDDFAATTEVISCGISNDVTCDFAFAEMGKKVLQFDHTVPGPPVAHANFSFFKQAIDESLEIPGSTKLSDVVRNAGQPGQCDVILKIDIDGGEWQCFADFPQQHFSRLRQIACEFHWSSKLTDQAHFAQCEQAIRNITAAFFPVHVHANNFVGFSNLMGVPMPEVFEVTFANRAVFTPGSGYVTSPGQLDTPNNPDAPDLYLGAPLFQSTAVAR